MARDYSLKEGKPIYCVENLGYLSSDFNAFQIKNGHDNIKEVCVERFKKEKDVLSKQTSKLNYSDESPNNVDEKSKKLRINFFKRTLIPILLDPNDNNLKKIDDQKIDPTKDEGGNLITKGNLDNENKWNQSFDEGEYYDELVEQYEEERKILDKGGSKKSKSYDDDEWGGDKNNLDKVNDKFMIANELFSNKHKKIENEEEDNDYSDIYVNWDDDKMIISEGGLETLSTTFDEINEVLYEKSGMMSKLGYNIGKGFNSLSNSKFVNYFRSKKKNTRKYLGPIEKIEVFLNKNKDNLINFISERNKYLSNIEKIIDESDDDVAKKQKLEDEYKDKEQGSLRVQQYATMMLMNRLKDSINSLETKKQELDDESEYKDKDLASLLFKIYQKAKKDYDDLKFEYDNIKQSNSKIDKYEDETEEKDNQTEKNKENENQENSEKFEESYYFEMFQSNKIANYLEMRVKMQLIKIFLKTNFFGFAVPSDDEKEEKDFEFKKKQIINIVDKQSKLKYTSKQVFDILININRIVGNRIIDDQSIRDNGYESLEEYFSILSDNLKLASNLFDKLGKKWTTDDNDEAVKRAKQCGANSFYPIGEKFQRWIEKGQLKKFINQGENERFFWYRGCLSFNKNDFDKALKKAEEIRATYGIS